MRRQTTSVLPLFRGQDRSVESAYSSAWSSCDTCVACTQTELGIGPLGHRRMLLESFAELRAGAAEIGGRSARPQSAAARRPDASVPTSPDAARTGGSRSPQRPGSPLRVGGSSAIDLRRRERLLRELERAEARAAQRRACAAGPCRVPSCPTASSSANPLCCCVHKPAFSHRRCMQ